MPYIVALSGGIASGKTTVANLFAKLGVPVIDADIIARQIVAPNQPALAEIVRHFSEEILLPNGELDRLQLREIIFNNDHERLWLNQLLHSLIQQETAAQLSQLCSVYALWVVPLLIENNLHHLADRVVIIDVSTELQLARLINRDHIDETLAKKMVLAQAANQKRLSYAHHVITNQGDVDDLMSQVSMLHHQFLNEFSCKGKSK